MGIKRFLFHRETASGIASIRNAKTKDEGGTKKDIERPRRRRGGIVGSNDPKLQGMQVWLSKIQNEPISMKEPASIA
ncbi:MAG TPA: hypothetical protein VHD56_12025 [Tepidisphaeraceae bacterium]|nr:hypothetical protein [Tepidisphaeraceae bacterium]